jgi:hypothetical protein
VNKENVLRLIIRTSNAYKLKDQKGMFLL